MAIKPIITLPDPLLHQPSLPIERVDDELLRLADDMIETMYSAQGIGLAAVQVGVLRRLIVVDVDGNEKERQPLIFINPEIVDNSSKVSSYQEGCLSIPSVYAEVERPASVTVRYINSLGKQEECSADGLLATCLQHEIDHLNGLLFIDHLSKLKRNMVIKRFNKLQRQNNMAL